MTNKILGRLTIRFSEDLISWIKAKAKDNSRSMNGELVEIVKKAKEKEETEKA